MTILLNGKNHKIDAPASVDNLLAAIGLENKPVVVELNQTALFPREYAETSLEEGDKVEIITIAAGG